MFDCHKEMSSFHGEEVTLTQTQRNEMRERRNNGRTRLESGLERDGHPLPDHHSQGSYAMHTMVQDDDNEYDIDDGAYFKEGDLADANGNSLTPRQAKDRVRDALAQDKRMANDAEVHRNCVRQPYPQGYHIDIPVYRTIVETDAHGRQTEKYELASENTWEVSDAREVTRWFKDQVSKAGDNAKQLRKVVRLTKFYARSRKAWKERTGSGITITRLVCDEFAAVKDRDDQSLRDTWKRIHARLLRSLRVEHPVGETPLAKEGDEKVAFLRDKLQEALDDLLVLDNDPTRGEARAAWDKVFDTDFFCKQPSPSNGGDGGEKKSRFVVVDDRRDQRDDGGRRYG
ncbi:cyclic GMP-AMP synthase DncV-like nucleotidyltransferase [Burkholderia metallica]